MKRLLKFVGTSGLLCLLFAIPATAQITVGLTFTTPFPFYAGNTKLPAGSYKVTPSQYATDILLIDSSNGSHSAYIEYVQTQAGAEHKATEVAFKKYGTTDFLDTIWLQGQQFGMLIAPTRVEKKIAESGSPQAHSVPAKGQ